MKCSSCNGEGGNLDMLDKWEECDYCNGYGEVGFFKKLYWDWFIVGWLKDIGGLIYNIKYKEKP